MPPTPDSTAWSAVPEERMNEHVTRRVLHTANLTVGYITLARGSHVGRHEHEAEQVCLIQQGRLRFNFDSHSAEIGPGEFLSIPSRLPHSVDALEDSIAIDVFAPRREDWIRGDDAYLRK